MVTIKNKTIGEYNRGEITLKKVAQELLEKYPITELAETLAEVLLTKQEVVVEKEKKIAVSEEDYQRLVNMFRVIQHGTGRGRKKKEQ